MSQRWRYVAAALLFVAAGLFTYLRVLPAYSESEIQELQGRVHQMRSATATESCERTPHGNAAPLPEGLSRLFEDPEILGCLTRFRTTDIEDLFDAPMTGTHAWHWELDRGDDNSSVLPGHVHMRVSAPIPPEDAEPPDVVRECARVGELVDRLAATPNLCSPLGPAHPDWLGDMMWGIGLGRAISTLARWRAPGGRRFRSFEEALRGIVVVRDLRRGPTSLLLAMISIAAEAMVVAQLQSFIIDDPEFTPEQYAQLDATLAQILTDRIGAGSVMRTDRFATVDGVTGDEFGGALDYIANFDASWCPDDAPATECIEAIRRMPAVEPHSEWVETILGRRLTRRRQLAAAARDAKNAFAIYLARLAAADVQLQQLRVLLRLSQARATSEACPPTIDSSHFVIDASDDPFELNHFSGEQYELVMPPLRAMPSFERTVLMFTCPAATPAWLPRVDI